MKLQTYLLALTLTLTLTLLLSIGCATSKSYRYGVGVGHPVVAQRLDKYADQDVTLPPRIIALRESAQQPVTYEKASRAWRAAQPVYRRHIDADEGLSPFIKQEYLLTADKLDELNAAEAKRRGMLFLPP